MKPIIMAFGEQETCNLLQDSLSNHYPLLQPENVPPVDEPVDLCIVDAPGLAQLDSWLYSKKAAEAPIDFPVLLAISADDLPAILKNHQRNVDGLIVIPFEPAELLAQVRMLLRVRERTRQLKSQAENLVSISKAIESTSDAISISDTTGKAIYLNHAFTDLYGFQVNELNVRGIPNSLFVNPQIAADIFRNVQRGKPWRGEVALRTRQGLIVPTLLRADSIEDNAGRRIGLISVHTDITKRKQAEAFQKEQRAFEKALRDSSAALTSTLELDEVLDRILTNIGHVVSHHMAQVMLIEDGVAQIVRVTGFEDNRTQAWLLSQRYSVTKNPDLRRMFTSGQPVIRTGTTSNWHDTYPLELRKIRSYIGVPIRLKGSAIGFLYLFSPEPGFFTPIHADRLQIFVEHAAIAIQNAQLHEKSQQLAALQERQRLAHELHDAVSQTLYSTSVIAEALPHLWDRDPEKVKPQLAQLHRLTRGALAEMRTLLLELRPSTLIEADFYDLLQQLAVGLQGRTHIEVTLDINGNHSLPKDVQVAFFYITQEALNNVAKHAGATQVVVSLHGQPDQMELSIIDNGRGFDPDQIESTSMGLGIMRERAQEIGASLSVTGQIGHGSKVVVIWTNANERKDR
jgi:PAS domain S-box-containing protein